MGKWKPVNGHIWVPGIFERLIDALLGVVGFVVAAVIVSVITNSIGGGSEQQEFPTADEEFDYKPEVYQREIPRFKSPRENAPEEPEPVVAEKEVQEAQPEASLSRPQLARLKKEPRAPTPLPLNLFSGTPPKQDTLSTNYAPFGRLVPCELTITVESNSINTPIIGLVTEDVFHAGKLIIPAGAEVHGRASQGRIRDRIASSGTWNFVWRTQDHSNGTELTLQGIALDRELDFNSGQWGIRDGSAGLKGYLIKSDSWNEIRLFASTFLAAAAQGIKDYDRYISDTGSSVHIARNTAGNAALDGTTAILEEYARQIRAAIERDGYYIRVPTGKQFYVYVTQTIDSREGMRGNASNWDIWNNEGKKNEG